jgi:CheY-like chemotaxis protein
MMHGNAGDRFPAHPGFTGNSMDSMESLDIRKIVINFLAKRQVSTQGLPSRITNLCHKSLGNLTDLSTGLMVLETQKEMLTEIEDKLKFGPRASFEKFVESGI